MGFYAWTQDVPIDARTYAEITARMGNTPMAGLVVHLAMEREDGSIHYLDVWQTKQEHDQAFETVVHPAVHPVLAEHGIRPAGEPPRTPITVLDVRFADGTSCRPDA
ncbi:MAG: hypothetical protein U0Q14_08880 [Dermatophilaceae bacterium]